LPDSDVRRESAPALRERLHVRLLPRLLRRVLLGALVVLLVWLVLQAARAEARTRIDPTSGQSACDPREDGALGDGIQTETVALQATLNRCAGGTVRLSPGRYRSGPLFVAAGTTLDLGSRAELIGVDDPAAYARPDGSLNALVNVSDASDVTIEGEGVIDGSGAVWWDLVRSARQAGEAEPPRPRLVAFDRCSHVRVHGVTLENSPSFHLVIRRCSDVAITNLSVTAPADSPNTDGIDVISSQDVQISDCTVDNGDDDIALKAPQEDQPHGGVADVRIERCRFLHGHGVSIGSETQGGVGGVVVADSSFTGTENGVRIKTNRDAGGPIWGLRYEHLIMQDVQTPIALASYYPRIPPDEVALPESATTPSLADVQICDLTATGGEQAGYIVGLQEAPYTNVRLTRVTVEAQSGLVVRDATVSVSDTNITTNGGPAYILQNGGVVMDSQSS
jgi:polygalacturonase